MCAQYWPPSEGSVEFGEYLVTTKEEWSHEGFLRKVVLARDTQVIIIFLLLININY